MNNPKCPYCGAEMFVKNMYETVAFACSCGSMSPVEYTEAEALASALRRTELDAAIADLKAVDIDCKMCAHAGQYNDVCESNDCNCIYCDADCICRSCRNNSNYQWRGLQKGNDDE